VKVDLVHGGPVHTRLGFGEPREDARGIGLDGGVESAGDDQPKDGPQVSVGILVASMRLTVRMARISMRVIVIMHVDIHLGCPEHALHDLAPLEGEAGQPELGELVAERLEGHARIHERPHDHVTRGPAGTVEIGEAHGQRILLASLLI